MTLNTIFSVGSRPFRPKFSVTLGTKLASGSEYEECTIPLELSRLPKKKLNVVTPRMGVWRKEVKYYVEPFGQGEPPFFQLLH
jgi:hypothetical protein